MENVNKTSQEIEGLMEIKKGLFFDLLKIDVFPVCVGIDFLSGTWALADGLAALGFFLPPVFLAEYAHYGIQDRGQQVTCECEYREQHESQDEEYYKCKRYHRLSVFIWLRAKSMPCVQC